MSADENTPGHVEQQATASGNGQINQAGRDLTVHHHAPVRPPLPQAMGSLPAGPGQLVGRQVKVDELLAALAPAPTSAGPAGESASAATVVVSAVAGLAGIGKTALGSVFKDDQAMRSCRCDTSS